MSKKIIHLNEGKRDVVQTLEAIKTFLHEHDENAIQTVYVRITATNEAGNEDIYCWQTGCYWDQLAMIEVEIRRMMDEYYDQCMGNE